MGEVYPGMDWTGESLRLRQRAEQAIAEGKPWAGLLHRAEALEAAAKTERAERIARGALSAGWQPEPEDDEYRVPVQGSSERSGR